MTPCKLCSLIHEGACAPSARGADGGAPPAAPAPVAGDRSAGGAAPAPVITGGVDRSAVAEIVRLSQVHGVSEHAPSFIERGLTPDQVAGEILAMKRTQGRAAPPPDAPAAGLPAKDRKRYSYRRAILAANGEAKLEGVEREVHEQIASNLPTNYVARGGVYIPFSLGGDNVSPEERLERALDAWAGRTRALDSKTAAGAAELVMDQPGGLIELLRKNTVVIESGARVLSGLTAPIVFTKQTGAATASWVGENPGADLADSQLTTGVITLSPKTLQSTTAFSRQLLTLASEDAERMVREDLAAIHALAIDKAALHGLGSSAQPTGIYQAPDVIAKAMGGGATWAKIVDMVAQCADANALDGTLGWVAQTLLAGRYMTIPKEAGQATYLWEGTMKGGSMVGYPARATSQLSKVMNGSAETGGSSYGLIFGNWAELIIGMWGALEMLPDPYAKKKQGLIELTTFQMTDILLRHGESFVKATGATLA